MKCLRRWLSALLCCALLLGVFSVGVSAADSVWYKIYQYHKYPNAINGSGLEFVPNNGTIAQETLQKEFIILPANFGKATEYSSLYRVSMLDDDILIKKGKTVDVRFNNVYFSVLLESVSSSNVVSNQKYLKEPENVYAVVTYTDNSSKTFSSGIDFVANEKSFNVSFNFTADKDVQYITYYATISNFFDYYTPTAKSREVNVTLYSGEYAGDDKYQYSIEIEDGSTGLLSGIKDFLSNIFDFIKNIPTLVWEKFQSLINGIHQSIQVVINTVASITSEIWSYFSEPMLSIINGIENFYSDFVNWIVLVIEHIVDLPRAIWEDYILEGLKLLFVPTEEDIADFKVEIEELMHTRLGAIYQVSEILTEDWDSVMKAAQNKTIELPEVTIDLPGKAEFTFGGYDVKIVPDKFGFLADSCKIITGILFTILFTNMLRKKYDEVIH